MKRSVFLAAALVVVGCNGTQQSANIQSSESAYHKVLGFESSRDTLQAQLFDVLERYSYTAEGGKLAPYFKGESSNNGIESYTVASTREALKCSKISGLAGSGFTCEIALDDKNLEANKDEKSIPAILYKAIANVRGSSKKLLTDSYGNTIYCSQDSRLGYSCELKLPYAVDKDKADRDNDPKLPETPDQPHEPIEVPAGEPGGDIPVFN